MPARPADGPGAPRWTVVHGTGMNAPAGQVGDFLIGPNYLPPPELAPDPGVPQGMVQQFTMDSTQSAFYPGISRDGASQTDPANPKTLIVSTQANPWQRTVTVYIPAQLKRGSRVPFMVVHDGPRMDEPDAALPRILDTLIARKRVPMMVAVMIQNGGGDAQGSQRGLEYDTLSGKFAEFIEAEILPRVESKYGVRLSRDPDKRAVMGCSSGAAAAWTMAWFHPEWYRRVVSYSGTFVNQQWPFKAVNPGGAWDYHDSIIASVPRKPIRIWMQVGDRDLYNPNVMRDDMHDWVAANHRMAAVLKSRNYRYQYVYALGSGHCDRKVREQTLPEALEWVWRGARVH